MLICLLFFRRTYNIYLGCDVAKDYFNLSNIINTLLFERKMRPAALARETGLPATTIHRLVTGKSTRPYKNSLIPIAEYFSLSVEQLIGEEELPDNYWRDESMGLSKKEQIKQIPIISWSDADNFHHIDKKAQQCIVSSGSMSDSCFALIMLDHSMEPLFPKRAALIFDPTRQALDRSFILVKLNNLETPMFRQLLIDGEHKYLKPLNPDLNMYKMRVLNSEDKIIAVLLESRINHLLEEEIISKEIVYE